MQTFSNKFSWETLRFVANLLIFALFQFIIFKLEFWEFVTVSQILILATLLTINLFKKGKLTNYFSLQTNSQSPSKIFIRSNLALIGFFLIAIILGKGASLVPVSKEIFILISVPLLLWVVFKKRSI